MRNNSSKDTNKQNIVFLSYFCKIRSFIQTVKKNTSYHQILKNTGILSGVQILTILMSVVRNKCAAIFIGAAGIGLTDLYYRTMELLGNTTNLGIPFSAIKRTSEQYTSNNKENIYLSILVIRTWAFYAGLAGVLVCCFFSPFISSLAFSSPNHTTEICILSPMIFCMTIYGSEAAIMKGVRNLKNVATSTALGALMTLIISVPAYYFGQLKGIIPALLLSSVSLTLIQTYFSTRIYPWKIKLFNLSILKKGKTMILLGITYILAGIIGSGAEVAVRAYINYESSMTDVGLYSAAFVLCVTYSRLVFVAMDADYFPRLASSGTNAVQIKKIVNDQITVCVSLVAPGLCIFLIGLPLIVNILYTPSFIALIPMAMAASLYIYLKAITLPIAYLSLAKGESIVYFVMELIYDVFFIICVITGYKNAGLFGAGVALSLANFFDLLLIYGIYHKRYSFNFTSKSISIILLQGILVVTVWILLNISRNSYMYGLSGTVFAVSSLFSYYILNQEKNIFLKRLNLRKNKK